MALISLDDDAGNLISLDDITPAKPVEGGLMASAKQAIGATIKGAGQAASDFFGADPNNAVSRYGQSVIDANPTAIHGFEDAASRPLTTVAEATGNAAGSMGAMLGARALGTGITAAAPLAGPAAPLVAGIGQLISWVAPAAIAALPSYGGIREKQLLDDPVVNDDAKSKMIAALGAGAVGLIETKFGPQQWALSMFTKEGRAALAEKFAASGLLATVGKGVVTGGAVEGAEELVQNPIEQLASYQDPTTAANVKDTLFGGFMGAVGGGVLGGGMGAVSRIGQATSVDEAIKAADDATRGAEAAIDAWKGSNTGPAALLGPPSAGAPLIAGAQGVGTPEQMAALAAQEEQARLGLMDPGITTDAAGTRRLIPGELPPPVATPEPAPPAGVINDATLPLVGMEAPADLRERSLRGLTPATRAAVESLIAPAAGGTSALITQDGVAPGQGQATLELNAATEAASSVQPAAVDAAGAALTRKGKVSPTVESAVLPKSDYGTPAAPDTAERMAEQQAARRAEIERAKGLQRSAPQLEAEVAQQELAPAPVVTPGVTQPRGAAVPVTQQTLAEQEASPLGKIPTSVGGVNEAQLDNEALRSIISDPKTHANTRRAAQAVLGARMSQPRGQAAPATTEQEARDGQVQKTTEEMIFGPGTRLRPAGAPATAGERVTDTMRKVLTQLGRLTGTKVVFVAAPGKADGAMYAKDGNTVYINTYAGVNPLQVMGHEVTHVLKKKHRAAWSAIRDAVSAGTDDAALMEFAREYWSQNPTAMAAIEDGSLSLDSKPEWLNTTESSVRNFLFDEMVSDLGGERWSDPAFWENVFAKIQEKHGDQAKGIIDRLVAAVKEMIARFMVLAKRDGFAEFRAGEKITPEQLNAVKAALEDAYSQFISAEQRNEPAGYQRGAAPAQVPGGEDDEEGGTEADLRALAGVSESTARTAIEKVENREGVIIGARPGEFDWTFASNAKVPPIQHPTQKGPRVEKLGPAVEKILKSAPVKKLIEDLFGVTNLKSYPTLGAYKGKPEPSFTLYGDGLDFNAADGMSRLLGFAFSQESTIVTQPVYADEEDTWPAFYVGKKSGKKLTQAEIDKVRDLAYADRIDYTTSIDGTSFKFFFDGSDIADYAAKVQAIAQASGLTDVRQVETRSTFNESQTYLSSGTGPDQRQAWVSEGSTGRSSLFGRTVDHLIVPYAKAVGAEGYRFSADLFGERFGLTSDQVEYIREALRPKSGEALSTAKIVDGTEILEVGTSDTRTKTPRPKNVDIMWALQNRAAQVGQISPGDYSDHARKVISQAIADEVVAHINRPGGKSAIGWYDEALRKAKATYSEIFPELHTDADAEMLFDALLGIASQGNDVHSNSVFAGRMYHLIRRENMSISQAVEVLTGTFGKETVAIENNYKKLEELLKRNGYDRIRSIMNKKMSVGEWNAILRRDETLWYDGKPLKVEGAARQAVNGWMVFGPKIGSFINNLHGDYSTLTADLWFSRTWNRILGFSFLHTPAQEAPKYQAFVEALVAEHTRSTEPKGFKKDGEPIYWNNGRDVDMTTEQFDKLIADPEAVLALAEEIESKYSKGFDFDGKKSSGYSTKSDLRNAAKNWVEHRIDSVALPRNDNERAFQQDTIEAAQKLIKRKSGETITVADIQAVLWYHEKDLFATLGVTDKKKAPADYADAAKGFMERYENGDLFYVEKPKPRYIRGEKGDYLGGVSKSERRTQTETPEFKRWSHGNKFVSMDDSQAEEFKPGEAVVVEALHGTTGDFAIFSRGMANIESDLGAGFYFTNTPEDVANNYAGFGPDLTQKVELLAERIAADTDREYNDPDVIAEARRRFVAHEGVTMPVYVRFDKPVVLGGSKETFLDYEQSYDEETDEYGEPTGALVDFIDALRDVASDERYDSADAEQAIADLMDRAIINGGLKASDVIEMLSSSEGLVYVTDMEDENGAMASREIIRLAFEAVGFDGFIDQNVNKKFGSEKRIGKSMEGMDQGTVHYVAFRPEQIKSAIGNSGAFDPTNHDIRRSESRTPWYYSQLTRSIEQAPAKVFGKGKVTSEWLRANAGKLGIKQDELQWSGITDWLQAQDKVTKDDVLGYLQQGGVQVQDVMLGDDAGAVAKWLRNADADVTSTDDGFVASYAGRDINTVFDTEVEAWTALHAEARTQIAEYEPDSAQTTKFKDYQLPGGENYRELLLTLPERSGIPGVPLDGKKDGNNFYSSHFSQPNILAHVRFNERTDADGNRVLFIEEIQSDWGQKGKKEGFADPTSPVYSVFAKQGAFLKSFETKSDADTFAKSVGAVVREEKRQPGDDSRPPSAPFVTDTKAWTALALKRMIAYAAENGFSKIAWTNGEQQAERYDLSKHLDRVEYEDAGDGKFEVIAYDKSGKEVFNEDEIGLGRVEEVLGKEIASKINNAEGEDAGGGGYRNWKKLSGLDLKVGGEGMRAFYDQIVPQVANDVLRKIGGGKVGVVDIGTKLKLDTYIKKHSTRKNEWVIFDAISNAYFKGKGDGAPQWVESEKGAFPFFSESSAMRAVDTLQDIAESKPQPGFDVPMGGEPLPLFSEPRSSLGELTPDQEKALRNTGGITDPVPFRQRLADLRKINWRQGLVDQFAPIKALDQRAYMLARLSKGGDGTVEAAMMYGPPVLDKDGAMDVDAKHPSGGFAKVLSALKGEHDRFIWWVAAQRAEQIKQRHAKAVADLADAEFALKVMRDERRIAQTADEYKFAAKAVAELTTLRDRLKAQSLIDERLFSNADISALKTLNRGREAIFATALKWLNVYNNAVLEVAKKSGLIDQAAVDMFKDQPYVPFYRVMGDEMPAGRMSSGMMNQRAWQKLKGGKEKLNEDLLANMLMNWSHIYTAAARNRAAAATMAASAKVGAAHRVPAGTKGAVKVMENGVAKSWMIDDPYVAEAVAAMEWAMPGWMRPLSTMKRWLTFGVTVSPFFKIRNLIRDSVSAIGQADLPGNPLMNVAKGWQATRKDNQTYASMLASGGVIRFGTSVEDNRAKHARRMVERAEDHVLDRNGWEKLTHKMRDLFDWYQDQGDRSEQVNRAALYEYLRAKGYTHADASFAARDLLDFSMSGRWPVVRLLAQTVPFLNARLQGLYKLGRAGADNPARLGYVTGAVVLASLALFLAYGDDDDWKRRTDMDRDTYWWFKIGSHAFKIPKPFEIGTIGTMAERTMEAMISKDPDSWRRFRESFARSIMSTFAMDPTPQAFKPIYDIYANKDSFGQRPIETMSMQRLRKEDRYDENTTEIAIALSKLGLPNPIGLAKMDYEKLSPVQIDHLVRAYAGWLGALVVGGADILFRPMTGKGDRPDRDLLAWASGNMVDELGKADANRYVSLYYDTLRDVSEANASYKAAIKAGDIKEAKEIASDEKEKLARYARLHSVEKTISEQSQMIKRIKADTKLTGEEKRRRIDKINEERGRVAALALSPAR